MDATAPDGSLLRPHIVFFGEPVPMFERAAEIAAQAEVMVVVGTSLAVYPAASLVRYGGSKAIRSQLRAFDADGRAKGVG